MPPPKPEFAIFSVAEHEYADFLSIMDDRQNLAQTFEEFSANVSRSVDQLRAQGVTPVVVVVPVAALKAGIEGGHIKADTAGRAEAAARMLLLRQ